MPAVLSRPQYVDDYNSHLFEYCLDEEFATTLTLSNVAQFTVANMQQRTKTTYKSEATVHKHINKLQRQQHSWKSHTKLNLLCVWKAMLS